MDELWEKYMLKKAVNSVMTTDRNVWKEAYTVPTFRRDNGKLMIKYL